MGAYADNNPTMRLVSYEQAVGKSNVSSGKDSFKTIRPEKVTNPYGSTAGAGSGEFHIYRHARARELCRLKIMHEEQKSRDQNQEYEAMIYNWKLQDIARTQKRKKKRQITSEHRDYDNNGKYFVNHSVGLQNKNINSKLDDNTQENLCESKTVMEELIISKK